MAQGVINHRVTVEDPPIAQLLFSDTRLAWFWLLVRLYVGYQWLTAGWGKLNGEEPGWVGAKAGTSIAGFVAGALKNTTGAHPSVMPFYAWFLTTFVQPYPAVWSYLITFGEIAVGVGLILGLLTGVAAFFGGMMNANYLLAGTVSTNPLLFIFATWLVLAWKVAGYYGIDHYLLPKLGVPGKPGEIFEARATSTSKARIA
jgi:thiosulfate dehydrogenase [quinone] large subunit